LGVTSSIFIIVVYNYMFPHSVSHEDFLQERHIFTNLSSDYYTKSFHSPKIAEGNSNLERVSLLLERGEVMVD